MTATSTGDARPHLSSARIRELVSYPDAVVALRSAFAAGPSHIERVQRSVAEGDFLLMGSTLEASDGDGSNHAVAGAKLVMVQPRNVGSGRPLISGTYVLFDADRGEPIATMDGAALTNLRTPAISVLAAQMLGRPGASRCAIVGRGAQGVAHEAAFRACLPSITTYVYVPKGETIPVADHVVGATSTIAPFLSMDMIGSGTHVTLVGAYRPDMAEVYPDVVIGSDVYVDERVAASVEAGDLIQAASAGWSWDRVAGDLTDLSRGEVSRSSDRAVTLFKSVGLAVEDLVIARLAAHRAGLFAL